MKNPFTSQRTTFGVKIQNPQNAAALPSNAALTAHGGWREFARKKLRLFTRCFTIFHDFTHRSGPYLRDFTHFYGYDSFFGDWRFLSTAPWLLRRFAAPPFGFYF